MQRAPEADWASASLVSWGSLSAMPAELILGRAEGRAMLHSCEFPGNRALLSGGGYCRVTLLHEALYNPAQAGW